MNNQPINEESKYFYELTPDKILDSVERFGIRTTGRIIQLNSMENRVYEVEIEVPDPASIRTPSDRFRVAKFYRPGRWTREQILEEHQYLADLVHAEIPVVAPLANDQGETLLTMEKEGIFFTLFPKAGGRSPDELDRDQAAHIGRLLARLHNVGGAKPAPHRLSLTPTVYGRDNLEFILRSNLVPKELATQYRATIETLLGIITPLFESVPLQRIHGDCHFGNVLWASEGPRMVDFDDMVMGPCVQDLWLLLPGRDSYAQETLRNLLAGYEQLRPFNYSTIRLIEPLRALRLIHFSAWIGRRWSDPAFERVFPQFGSAQYWREQIADIQDQIMNIQQGGFGAVVEEDLTN